LVAPDYHFFGNRFRYRIRVAWRNLVKSSDLQIRLIRASELNTHLKEMNLAAAVWRMKLATLLTLSAAWPR
jgi:hypothetical protein